MPPDLDLAEFDYALPPDLQPVPGQLVRVPHSGQKKPRVRLPLSAGRPKDFNHPVTAKSRRSTRIESPKALPDCRWHSVQWQR